jgi:alpha-tubulin suppressor-like RCC1 family protein
MSRRWLVAPLVLLGLAACVGELPTISDAEVVPPPRLVGGAPSTLEVTANATVATTTLATIEGGTEPLEVVGDPQDLGLRLASGLTARLVGNALQVSGTAASPGGRLLQEQVIIEDGSQSEGAPGARTGRRLSIAFSVRVNAATAVNTAAASDQAFTVGRSLPVGYRPVVRTDGTGTAPYTWSITPALPSGLTIAADGSISGTPSSSAPSTLYSITVADRYNSRATGTVRLVVNAAPALTRTDSVQLFTRNVALPAQGVRLATLAGGSAPFSVTLAPDANSLGGLTFDAATLTLFGTPQASVAPRTHTLTVIDANGATASVSLTLGVRAPLAAIVQRSAFAWTVGRPLPVGAVAVQPVRGSGGAGDITYSVTPALPSGVSLDPATGVLVGSPTQPAGPTTYTVAVRETLNGQPTGAQATASFSWRVNAAPTIAGADTVRCDQGVTCSASLGSVTGGTAPLQWTLASGALPNGLSFNGITGRLSGVPTRSGDVELTVRVTDSTGATAQRPVRLIVPFAWGDVSAGVYHTCALSVGGEAFCWGANFYRELGLGDAVSADNELVPRRVQTTAATSLWRAIRAGWDFSCGLTQIGEAYCWGRGENGRLGIGSLANRDRPTAVAAAGARYGQLSLAWRHACAIRSDRGDTECWGLNADGQVGSGDAALELDRPQGIQLAFRSLVRVGLGGGVSCGIDASAFGLCWGSNGLGQLGVGSTASTRTPGDVALPAAVRLSEISPNGDHACAVTTIGQLYCWGANNLSQRGSAPSGAVSVPQLLTIAGQSFRRVASGLQFSCALTTTDTVYCWGRNDIGQLGTGSFSPSETPRLVPLPADSYVDLVAGAFHVCVRSARGVLLCWGNNLDGQLGRGTTEPSAIPAPPLTPSASANVQRAMSRASSGTACVIPFAVSPTSGPPLASCANR